MNKISNRMVGTLLVACSAAAPAISAPVEFKVLADWGSGYNAQVILTNETDKTMADWRLAFDFEGDVKNLYSGRMISAKDGHFVMEGGSWNKTLKPGQSVTLGWNGSKGGVSRQLDNIEFSGTDIDVPAGPYFIGYDLQADWGTGFVASFSVANNSEDNMGSWELSFDYPYPITNVYNAKIISHEGDRYTIEGIDDGADLSPNEVTVFVVRGNVGGLSEQPANIAFTHK
ncbi:MAG: cellulase/cellobiase CelA1 [Alteromonadaceae bacterium]|jgi:cellulase/cellobiase CelA1